MKKLSLLLILLATSVCYAQDTISNHIDANNTRDTRYSVTYDFENGTMNPWTVIDADGDGYCWLLASEEISNAYGHNGSGDFVLSASYKNNVGALYPDNYLVSPQIQLGGYISFWACANDINYAAEHFGVAVSTTGNTNPNNFITIQEWTMTAKSEDNPDNPTRSGNRTQGVWYHYFVDLSYYAGQTGYIAIRHFNCSDMWYLDVDDIKIAQLYDFDDGTMQGWTNIDADGDGNVWVSSSNPGIYHNSGVNLSGTGHNSSEAYVISGSYANQTGQALYPDNYLVSPKIALGGSIRFYACAQDASYAAEHFGVAVSTTNNTSASAFTTIQEWTMSAKGVGVLTNFTRDGGLRQGNWYQYTVDLSAYSGMGYVAIRHFNCTDQFILNVDDIHFSTSSYGLPWNLMATFNAAEAAQYGVATDGQHVYTSDWGYSGSTYDFYKYDMNGNLIEGFNISGCSNIQDLTYDGQYFYGGNSGNMLYCINLAQKVLVSSTNTSATIRHCSYDPINNGFWVGGWNDLKLINRSGQILINAPNPYGCAGSGYYTTENGTAHLLLNCQLGGTVAEVYDYNIATNTIGSNPIFDLAVTPGYNGGIAGGAFVGEYNGKIAFFGDIQQDPNLIGIYELSSQLFNYYTITASASPTNGGSVYGSGTYAQGSTCPLSAVANNGYSFTNWTENGSVVSTNANYTFTVTGNRTLVAHFTQQHTINVSANPTNGGSVSGGGTYNHGQSCTVHAWANSGYTFTNWTENGSVVSTNANYTFAVNSNRTLVANFTVLPPNTYNINVSANPSTGGSVNGGGSYQQGQSCTVTATANTGYTFLRWTENGTLVSNNANYTFTVTGNRTLVAQFQANTYTISVSANPTNGGTVTGGGAYQYGQSCTVTATANTGYTFLRWTENGAQVSTNANFTFTVTGNRTLVAQFQQSTTYYTINATPSPSNAGTITGTGSYASGSTCTLTAYPNSSYSFVNWLENGVPVSSNATYSFTVTGNRNLVAVFDVATTYYNITVTAYPSNGGSVIGGGSYASGTTITLHATPNDGYSFVKWTKNGTQVSTNPNYSFTVNSNASFVAYFEQNATNYTITVKAEPTNGGIVSGGGSYASGTTCTIDATANDGYSFIKWTNNGTWVSSNPNYSFMVTGNASYVAHFGQNINNYVINVNAEPSDGGTVSGGGSYAEGATCILTASPNTDYIFEKWTENGTLVSTNPVYNFTVTENHSFIAHFIRSANHYTVTAIAIPANGGEFSGGGTYEQGATCTLTASANNGFSFVNWTDMAGTELSADSIYSFTVASNMICLANFKPNANTYNITASAEPLDGGTITGEGTYEAGATCTLIAIPNPTYSFVSWTENGIVISTEEHLAPFVVDRDRSFVAVFHQGLFYTITASAGNNGTISPEGNVFVEPNEDKTFAMIPNSGCQVSKVLVDGVDRGPIPSYTFRNVNENHTIHVEFSGLGVDNHTSLDLKVYPNPAHDKINIQCQNMKQVSILNLLGVQIESKDVNDDHAVLSTDNLSQGTYILKVENNDGRIGYTRFILVK